MAAMHDDQVHVGTELAGRLVAAQFPQWGDEPVLPVGGAGTENAIFRVGESLAARFPLRGAPEDVALQARRQMDAMAEFAAAVPVPATEPVALGEPAEDYPFVWAVTTWVDGEVATPDSNAASEALALDLAELVLALRAVPTDGRVFDGAGRGGHLPDHDGWMEDCFQESEGLLDVPALRALWADLRALPPAGPDVMSHRDLIPGNVLVGDGRLAGVLDTGAFGPADPALDLIVGWHLFETDARLAFRTAVGAGNLVWARSAAWAFQQSMGLVWYYVESNHTMSELGRSTLARILEDNPLDAS